MIVDEEEEHEIGERGRKMMGGSN